MFNLNSALLTLKKREREGERESACGILVLNVQRTQFCPIQFFLLLLEEEELVRKV